MKVITVRDKLVMVDDADFENLAIHNWRLSAGGYAIRTEGKNPNKKLRSMHREILNVTDASVHVDHIDGNKLNNTRENLRVVSRSQNGMNRKAYSNNTTGFKGVTFIQKSGKYQAQIKYDNKKKWLGEFVTPEEAHEVYCLAADLVHGQYANHG